MQRSLTPAPMRQRCVHPFRLSRLLPSRVHRNPQVAECLPRDEAKAHLRVACHAQGHDNTKRTLAGDAFRVLEELTPPVPFVAEPDRRSFLTSNCEADLERVLHIAFSFEKR